MRSTKGVEGVVADAVGRHAPRRRQWLQWAGAVVTAGAMPRLAATSVALVEPQARSVAFEPRCLAVYYSRTGHTRQAALAVAAAVGADVFEVAPATPFPASYPETVELNRRQRDAGVFPAVERLVPDLAAYDTVVLGYPIWAVDLPRLLVPFLRQQDFTGKTLLPFSTSAMSGLAGTERSLRRRRPQPRRRPPPRRRCRHASRPSCRSQHSPPPAKSPASAVR